MSPPSDPPKRRKASEVIIAAADQLFANWNGPNAPSALERVRLALRARQAAAEAYQDEDQARRDAFERDVLERLRQLEKHAHTHPNSGKAGT